MVEIGPFLEENVNECAFNIFKSQCERIGLQFSEIDLPHAIRILRLIRKELFRLKDKSEKKLQSQEQPPKQQIHQKLFVMSDVARSSCCVDFITAAHVNCDLIVHFGEICTFSKVEQPKVMYVYHGEKMDVIKLVDFISKKVANDADLYKKFSKKNLVIGWDYRFLGSLKEFGEGNFVSGLEKGFSQIEGFDIGSVIVMKRGDIEGREFGFENEKTSPIWIGSNTDYLLSTALSLGLSEAFSIKNSIADSENDVKAKFSIENVSSARLLSKRYYLVEKLREAKVVGIVVTSFSSEKYIHTVDYLRSIIRAAGKRAYVLSVGKITEPKLENYPSIDIFVAVSCSLGFIVDPKAYAKEVANPLDVEFAFGGREWDGKYDCRYENLKLYSDKKEIKEKISKEMSLSSRCKILSKCDCKELAVEIQKMTYFGMEGDSDDPDAEPSLAKPGRHGIAKCYEGKF